MSFSVLFAPNQVSANCGPLSTFCLPVFMFLIWIVLVLAVMKRCDQKQFGEEGLHILSHSSQWEAKTGTQTEQEPRGRGQPSLEGTTHSGPALPH